MSIFSSIKDRMIERAALSYLNSRMLAPYGQATKLCIDTNAKTVQVEVELKGETEPVRVDLTSYEIVEEGGRYYAVVDDIRTSREWLTTLAREQLCRKRVELPPEAGRLLAGAL